MRKHHRNGTYYVALKWLDSVGDDGWVSVDEEDDHLHVITSIGIALRRPTKSYPYWVICRDVGDIKEGRVSGKIRIPRGAVLEVQEFEWPFKKF